jgi:hypothetical protein
MGNIVMRVDGYSAQVGEIGQYSLMAGVNEYSIEARQLSKGEVSDIAFNRDRKTYLTK